MGKEFLGSIIFLFHFIFVQAQNEKSCFCIDEKIDGCNECNEGCFKSFGQCLKCPDYCISCSSKKSCSKCFDGMRWNGTNCVRCNEFCERCDNSDNCLMCESGKFLSDNECNFCQSLCDTCENLNDCTSCNPFKDLIQYNNTCVFCNFLLPHCVSCQNNSYGNGTCILCEIGYFISNGICVECDQTCGPSGCGENGCFDCKDDLILFNNECISLENSHCEQAINSKCAKCVDNYYLINGNCFEYVSCDGTTVEISPSICISQNEANCLDYSYEKQQCTSCINLYKLIDGVCVSVSSLIEHCLIASKFFDEIICLVCENNYYPMNGICFSQEENDYCLQVFNTMNIYEGSSSRCLNCVEGVEPINNHCVFIPHCNQFYYEECVKCQNNYLLMNGICVSMEPFHCLKSNGVDCTQCFSGYLLNTNSICSSIFISDCIDYSVDKLCCVHCINNKTIFQCNCVECYLEHCSQCSGFYENICEICEKGYYLVEGQCNSCKELDEYCSSCNEFTCFSCAENLMLNEDNTCVNCSSLHIGCSKCNATSCLECGSNNYFLYDGKCLECDSTFNNCLKCNPLSCIECESGYFLESNNCHSCNEIEGCVGCDKTKRWCLECSLQYYLNQQTHLCENCSQKTIGCSECDLSLNCNECLYGQINQNQECFVPVNNCIVFNSSEICIDCEKGYVMRNNACKKYVNEEYCLSYSNYHSFGCEECSNSVTSSGICSSNERNSTCHFTGIDGTCFQSNTAQYIQTDGCNVPNCYLCSSLNVCALCKESYILNKTNDCDLVEHCLAFALNQCLKCEASYFIVNGLCEKYQTIHCNYYVNNEKEECLECENGYVLIGNECLWRADCNCVESSNSHCILCDEGYHLSENGVCELNTIGDCLIEKESKCHECKTTNLITFMNESTTCSSVLKTDNCFIESKTGCQRCSKGYFLHYKQCISCGFNCAKCVNRKDECIECFYGFVYNGTSRICTTLYESSRGCLYFLPNKRGCAACKKGFYYDRINYKCNKCDESCLECENDSKYCISCDTLNGYYRALDNSCQLVSTISHCLTFENDLCTSCAGGYYLEENRCVGCQTACANCTSKTNCSMCFDQYVYRNSTQECIYYQDIIRCIEYSNHRCSKCSEMYEPSEGGDECVYSWTFFAVIGTPSFVFLIFFFGAIFVIVFVIIYFHRREPKKENWNTKEVVFEVKKSDVRFVKIPKSKLFGSSLTIDFSKGGKKQINVNEKNKIVYQIANKNTKLIQLRFLGIKNENFDLKVEPSIVAIHQDFGVDLTVSVKTNCSCSFSGALPFGRLNMKTGEMNFFSIPIIFVTEKTKRIAYNEVTKIKMIGESIFGTTYKATYDGQFVAMKVVKLTRRGDENSEIFQKDVITVDKCSRGRYISDFIGAIFQPEHMAIVTEYAPLGSLKDLMIEKINDPIVMDLRYKILLDAAKGIQFLHSKNQMHCDLKPQNILIYSYNSIDEINAKLTDCGFKRNTDILTSNASFCNGIVDVQYIAPEVLNKDLYLTHADVFSFGMVMCETLQWSTPFPKEQFPYEWTIAQFIIEGKRPPFRNGIEKWSIQLINECWKQNPFDRISSNNIVMEINKYNH